MNDWQDCRECGARTTEDLVDGLCPDCEAEAYQRNAEAWRGV